MGLTALIGARALKKASKGKDPIKSIDKDMKELSKILLR